MAAAMTPDARIQSLNYTEERGELAVDLTIGGFEALGGPQKRAFYALFPDVALPEKYMSKGQKAQAKTAKEYDFAAMVGRPRDTRYDIDDDDSEEDEEPVAPAPKKRRVIEDLEDDV